jgi:hypothetical protein
MGSELKTSSMSTSDGYSKTAMMQKPMFCGVRAISIPATVVMVSGFPAVITVVARFS